MRKNINFDGFNGCKIYWHGLPKKEEFVYDMARKKYLLNGVRRFGMARKNKHYAFSNQMKSVSTNR